jgi:uncharacterized protein (TIGR00730 family)
MRKAIKTVCIYCASSNQVAPKYFQAAAELAKVLAGAGIHIVYGGGGTGLMGQVATSALEHGGHVIGIIPAFMKAENWDHPDVEHMHIVADMHERKRKFIEQSDAIIALPGGCGTFEELFEAITLKQLGQHTHPIIIVNVDGYYDDVLNMLNKAVNEKFMGQHHRDCWSVITDPKTIIHAIQNAPGWSEDAINTAALL